MLNQADKRQPSLMPDTPSHHVAYAQGLIDTINAMTVRENAKTRELERAYARIKYLETRMEHAVEMLNSIPEIHYTHAQKNGVVMSIAAFIDKTRTSFSFASPHDDMIPF